MTGVRCIKVLAHSVKKIYHFIVKKIILFIILPSKFVCRLFHLGMSQNNILILKIKVINLLIFLLYPYFIFKTI